ncbi:MAG: hypothetical protein OD918_04965 [Gammaproteobacteria bacterium]
MPIICVNTLQNPVACGLASLLIGMCVSGALVWAVAPPGSEAEFIMIATRIHADIDADAGGGGATPPAVPRAAEKPE